MNRRALACLILLMSMPATASQPAPTVLHVGFHGTRFVITNRPAPGRDLSPVVTQDPPSPEMSRRPDRSRAPADLEDKIHRAAQRHGLDADLVKAVIHVESRFDPWARSPAGAIGLMQLMPATAARFGVTNPFDVQANLDAGCRYLAHLIELFAGNVSLALAAYNAGEGAVIAHGNRIPPYAETKRYVPSVLNRWRELSQKDLPG